MTHLSATDRTPTWYGTCDQCGQTPALTVGHSTLCPTCQGRQTLVDAAELDLWELLTPILAAWAQHWQSVGLPLRAVASSCQAFFDGLTGPRTVEHLHSFTHDYPVPEYPPHTPQRLALAASDRHSV